MIFRDSPRFLGPLFNPKMAGPHQSEVRLSPLLDSDLNQKDFCFPSGKMCLLNMKCLKHLVGGGITNKQGQWENNVVKSEDSSGCMSCSSIQNISSVTIPSLKRKLITAAVTDCLQKKGYLCFFLSRYTGVLKSEN